MAGSQVKVPVIGRVPKVAAYAGGAAVIGIAGYAWMTRKRGAAAAEATDVPVDPTADPAYTPSGFEWPKLPPPPPPTVVPKTVPSTNTEWFDWAVEYCIDLGYAPEVVAPALSKYLGSKSRTAAEEVIVGIAVGRFGRPPAVPAPAPVAVPAPPVRPVTPPVVRQPAPTVYREHIVLKGQTIQGIASKYGTSIQEVWKLNPGKVTLESNKPIKPATVLRIPPGRNPVPAPGIPAIRR